MFFQIINIAMNNAFILYDESDVEKSPKYKLKAPYLNEVAYRMCRPWAIVKYGQTDNRHHYKKTMLNMPFKLPDQERGDRQAPPPAVAPAVEPAVAPAALPHWLPHNPPATVKDAVRDVPTSDAGDHHPYLGGRWFRIKKTRCSYCPQTATWHGKYKCESPRCGHKDVCPHHSVILCQNCFYCIDN